MGRQDFLNPAEKEQIMNWDEVTGNWQRCKDNIKEKWGKLPDNDLGIVSGKFNQILDRIPVRHTIESEEAKKELKDWEVSK
jgi:uncharacterized protein YjbJ (UPF0337 family)